MWYAHGEYDVPTKCFNDYGIDMHQRVSVGDIGEATWTDDGIELGLGLLQNLWMQ